MKKLNETLFITELPDKDRWILSWKSPQMHTKDEVFDQEISKEEASKLLSII